nr:MAG: movement protein [Jiangsu sediment phenui-like virus]
MFRKLLGAAAGGSGGGQSSGASGGDRRGRKGKGPSTEEVIESERELGAIRRGVDDSYFASGMPTKEPTLGGKVDSHRAGELFKYAVIANAPSTERVGLFDKLRSYKPASRVASLTLNDVPAIRMLGNEVNFPLKRAVQQNIFKGAEDFVLIDCVLVHFVPLDSLVNDKSVITVQINDFRKREGTTQRAAKIDNKMGYNILFSLDYCVETRDMDKMTLSFACPANDFQEGISWGTVKVVIQLQFLSFPRRMPLQETLGVMVMSDTDLDKYAYDPRMFDIVLTPDVLNELRGMKERGEIENLTVARDDKKELETARTILMPNGGNEEVGSIISRMKEMQLLKNRQDAAAIERRKKLQEMNGQVRQATVEEVSDDEDCQKSLKDVEVGESVSQVGTASEIGRSKPLNQVQKKSLRFEG